MMLKITKIEEPKEASACECLSCKPLNFTTVGNIKSVEVIHSYYKNWKLVNFDMSFLKNGHATNEDTSVLVMTVEFMNGEREIYIAETCVYLLDAGKTADTYYP